jgi:hypothetical protein
MGFFNDKKRTYILPDIQYRRRGLFNGKVGPGWFRPMGHMPMVQVHKAPAENFWCILRARY